MSLGVLSCPVGEEDSGGFDMFLSADYDALGRMTLLEVGRTNTNDPNSPAARLEREFDGDTARLVAMKAIGRGNGSQPNLDLELEFDGLGRLTSMDGSYGADALVERSFTYDGLGRLATATGPWEQPQGETGEVTWTYSYDVLGNLRSQTSESSAPYERTWTYADPNRPRFLTQFEELVDPNTVVTETMVADAAGNPTGITTSSGFESMVWNGQGRMASKGDAYTNGINYFDWSGKRVMRWWAATQIVYVGDDFEYDTALEMGTKSFFLNGERVASRSYYFEAQSAWIPPWAYRFGIEPLRPLVVPALLVLGALGLWSLLAVGLGAPLPPWAAAPAVALLAAALVLYPTSAARAIIGGGGDPEWHGGHSKPLVIYGNDHLGSTRVVIDAEGDTIETRDYAPFGKTIAWQDPYDLKHRFTSQPYDDGVELYNYGARMYEPRWGRFVSPDELVEGFDSQGLNPYSYVRNRPTSATDPTGNAMSVVGDTWNLGNSPDIFRFSPTHQWGYRSNHLQGRHHARTVGGRWAGFGYGGLVGAASDPDSGDAIPDPPKPETELEEIAGLWSDLVLWMHWWFGINMVPTTVYDGPGDPPRDKIVKDAAEMASEAISAGEAVGSHQSRGDAEREETPTTNPEGYEPVRGSPAKRNRESGEIWQKDPLHKNHYEVYRNKKQWENGRRDRSVWDDGRPKEKF